MDSSNNIVQVARQTEALTSPSFIIEQNGRFYVTVAVLEYDPNAADMTDEQKRGVEQIKEMFEASQGVAPSTSPQMEALAMDASLSEGAPPPRAARIEPLMAMAGCMNTGPVIRR